MKKIWKKYLALFCVLVCMLSLTACGKEKKEKEKVAYSEETADFFEKQAKEAAQSGTQYTVDEVAQQWKTQVISYIESNFVSAERSELEALVKEDEEANTAAKSYLDATKGIGAYKEGSAYNVEIEMSDTSLDATGMIEFEKRDVSFTLSETTDDSGQSKLTISFEKDLTMGEILKKAGMNTLLGMGTVFLVLILISFVISAFGLMSGNESKSQKSGADAAAAKTPEIPADDAPQAETDVTADTELAAVIAAAVAAYEGTSADGFVVRSIKRIEYSRQRRV